jgi:hypothetical protein
MIAQYVPLGLGLKIGCEFVLLSLSDRTFLLSTKGLHSQTVSTEISEDEETSILRETLLVTDLL